MRVNEICCMNVLVYARACDPACLRYRLGEINSEYGYILKCINALATANSAFAFVFSKVCY